MATLFIHHRRRHDRARLLLVHPFDTRPAGAKRRCSRTARASTGGAIVIGCSAAGGVPWETEVTDRGIVFRQSAPSGAIVTDGAAVEQEELA